MTPALRPRGPIYRAIAWRPLWLAIGVATALAIVVLSLGRPLAVGPDVPGIDKLNHIVAYAVLTGWFAQLVGSRRSLWFHALAALALGTALEALQALRPLRSVELYDMAANATGVAIGIAIGLSPLATLLERAVGGPAGVRDRSG